MKVVSIIVAAGRGTRYGRKKQFEKIKPDKIVIDYSVEKLIHYGEVIIVASKEDIEFLRKRYGVLVVEGGTERRHSVLNGLRAVKECDIVLIHDAARPVIGSLNIDSLIKSAIDHGAAIFSVPIRDTVKLRVDGYSTATLNREKLALSQTPQAFRFDKLLLVMKKYIEDGVFTDEAALWEKFYGLVKLVDGSVKNIKITTREDLELVKCLLE